VIRAERQRLPAGHRSGRRLGRGDAVSPVARQRTPRRRSLPALHTGTQQTLRAYRWLV